MLLLHDFVHACDVYFPYCAISFATHNILICFAFFRHKQLELLRQVQVHEDSCTLCFDNHATVTILPCKHR